MNYNDFFIVFLFLLKLNIFKKANLENKVFKNLMIAKFHIIKYDN